MSDSQSGRAVSPILVGISAWLIPGAGYWLIGHRARGITVGITILFLFVFGILIGGIRVMDPPGWGEYGYMPQIVLRDVGTSRWAENRIDPTSVDMEANPTTSAGERNGGSALMHQPIAELGERPWFAGQILCGPVTLIASAVSVHEAHPITVDSTATIADSSPQEGVVASHARSWEIGTLYTAVAGMLNLLVIIDSSFRAAERKFAEGKSK